MAAHRYWRILFTASTNGVDVDLGWVKFFTTVDLDATAVASPASTGGTAISGENYNTSHLAATSFTYSNGETSGCWWSLTDASTFGTTKWIGYDFGAGNDKEIVAYSMAYYSVYSPTGWQFQYSDNGTTWTTVDTITGYGWDASTSAYFRCPTAPTGTGYRFWRIYGSGTGTIFSIGELELHTTIGGSDIITSPYTTMNVDSCAASWASYGPRKTQNNSAAFLTDCWRSASDSGAHWLLIDFGKKVNPVECVMNAGPSGEVRSSVKVQASNDKTSWVDFGTFPAFTAAYQQKTLTLTDPGGGVIARRRQMMLCN